jgi:hypothetical protein
VQTANTLLGRPYVHHTLEGNATEQLVVNTREFDCTTFIETTLAIALAGQEMPAKFTPVQWKSPFVGISPNCAIEMGRSMGMPADCTTSLTGCATMSEKESYRM